MPKVDRLGLIYSYDNRFQIGKGQGAKLSIGFTRVANPIIGLILCTLANLPTCMFAYLPFANFMIVKTLPLLT
jgi:hypothetical protein